MVLSTALFDKPAFKSLVCNGLILAEDGKKMSKRLRNYPVSTPLALSFHLSLILRNSLCSVSLSAMSKRLSAAAKTELRALYLPICFGLLSCMCVSVYISG